MSDDSYDDGPRYKKKKCATKSAKKFVEPSEEGEENDE